MNTSNKINWFVAAVGVWEILAPLILGYSDLAVAVWNTVIVGIAVVVLAVWSALSDNPSTVRALDWINAILGGWLIIAPFILGYSTFTVAALWNPIIAGIIIAVLEVWAGLSVRSVEVT